jgi:hypothetical protein
MLYTEYRFNLEMISETQAQAYKDSMEAASFTAWQIGVQKGLKQSWKEYRSSILGSDEKIDKDEAEEAMKIALEIHKKYGMNTQ